MVREVQKGSWIAQLEVKELPPDPALVVFKNVTNVNGFKTVDVDCQKKPIGNFLDVAFESCTKKLFVKEWHLRGVREEDLYPNGVRYKNYSSNWFEYINGQSELNPYVSGEPVASIGLLRPSEEGDIYITREEWIESTRTNVKKNKFSVRLRKLDSQPSRRRINVVCGDKPTNIWGIKFVPKCTPTGGTYIDVYYKTRYIHLNVDLLNGQTLQLRPDAFGGQPGFDGKSGSMNSTGSSMNFDLVFISKGR